VPVEMFAQVHNRALVQCTDVRWTARKGTVLMFSDKPGCHLFESFFTPFPPGGVELTATYSDAQGSDSDTVIIDLFDDGFARIQITAPAVTDFDHVITVASHQPTTLNAVPRRIPAGNPFTWSYQADGGPVQVIGGTTATTTATFAVAAPDCGTTPGTIHVTAFDSFGFPIHDEIKVAFTEGCIVK